MESKACPSCKNLLCITALSCPNCGHVPLIVLIRNSLFVTVASSWAVVSHYGENAAISFIAAYVFNFSILVLMMLLMVQLKKSIAVYSSARRR